MKKSLTCCLLLLLALTGCGGVEKDASYESVTELREAVLASDAECPGQTGSGGGAEDGEELLRCDDDLTLRWFVGEDDLKMGKIAMSMGLGGDGSYLSGPNWIIQGPTDDLAGIQESLGGELSVP